MGPRLPANNIIIINIAIAVINMFICIGVAGIIMGAAFSGLLFSSTMMNQQLSLVMVVGIFFDTVFMQSMLVPAIMTVLGEWNWYPSSYDRGSIRSSRGSAGAAASVESAATTGPAGAGNAAAGGAALAELVVMVGTRKIER